MQKYLVHIRYKNGEEKMFETEHSACPFAFPGPIIQYRNVANGSGGWMSDQITVENPVQRIQKWDNNWVNVYEILDITIVEANDK